MNVNFFGVSSASLNRIAQPAQDNGIIIVGGKSGGAQRNAQASVFNRVALNPQPLPPRPGPDPGPYLKNILASAFNRVALNPQPLPPKEVMVAGLGVDSVSLNPQLPGGNGRSDDKFPAESVGFNYGKIEWTYTQQKRADGSGGGNVTAGWDLIANKR